MNVLCTDIMVSYYPSKSRWSSAGNTGKRRITTAATYVSWIWWQWRHPIILDRLKRYIVKNQKNIQNHYTFAYLWKISPWGLLHSLVVNLPFQWYINDKLTHKVFRKSQKKMQEKNENSSCAIEEFQHAWLVFILIFLASLLIDTKSRAMSHLSFFSVCSKLSNGMFKIIWKKFFMIRKVELNLAVNVNGYVLDCWKFNKHSICSCWH